MLRRTSAGILAAGLFLVAMEGCGREETHECAAIANRYERLDCYDRFYVTDEIGMSVISDWTVQQVKAEFDGTRNIYMWVESKEPLICPESNEPSSLKLYLRCRNGQTAIYFNTGCLLSDLFGHGRVDMRVGTGNPFTAEFEASADNTSLGLWTSSRSVPIVTRMMGGERLFARIKPFNGRTVTTQFNIGGLATASNPLRQACRW